MKRKALYMCCIAEPWIKVAKQLETQGVIPVYMVHWVADEAKFKSSFLGKCHLQTVQDAWKGLGFPSELSPKRLDEIELKELAWHELNALKMMDRLDPLGNQFGFQERRYFFQDLVGYWLACIDSYEIDVVVSPSIPHRVFDYALYIASKIRKVKFLMFQMLPFGSNSILIDNIESMEGRGKGESLIAIDYTLSPLVLERIARVKSDYSTAVPTYMVAHENNQKASLNKLKSNILKPFMKIIIFSFFIKKQPNTYWVEKGKMPCETNYSWLHYYYMVFQRARKVRNMKRQYKKLVSEWGDRFVLVALHYQPEETSCPTGGSYADQINIINLLDDVLPNDIEIVVKEHKSQFYTHQEGASGRDCSFYRRLNSLPSSRIKFADINTNPFELIDKAIATVTISGTIGWESAIRGTPTVVFGRAWYENMPRVHKVKSREDLKMALTHISKEKNVDLEREILDYHARLEKHFILSKHYKAFLNNTDVDMGQSVVNLSKAISGAVLK